MVDMTGRLANDAPLPPPSPTKPGREKTDHGQLIAAGFCMVIAAGLTGLGIDLDQWWLAASGCAALALFWWLFLSLEGELRRDAKAARKQRRENR